MTTLCDNLLTYMCYRMQWCRCAPQTHKLSYAVVINCCLCSTRLSASRQAVISECCFIVIDTSCLWQSVVRQLVTLSCVWEYTYCYRACRLCLTCIVLHAAVLGLLAEQQPRVLQTATDGSAVVMYPLHFQHANPYCSIIWALLCYWSASDYFCVWVRCCRWLS
jgi:hypothetical protein